MRDKKSLEMKNFIFKSKDKSSDFTKIFILINQIQTEQRHARGDLKQIMNMCTRLIESIQETSPQTESIEQIPEEEGI